MDKKMSVDDAEKKIVEINDKILLQCMKMQRVSERLGDEMQAFDEHVIETHKELVSETQGLGTLLEELIEYGKYAKEAKQC